MNDLLTTMLRDAAVREALPPAPPAYVRRHAEKVRNRRRAGAAVAGVAAAAAVVLASQGTLSGMTLSWDTIGASRGNTPAPAPTTSLPGPSASNPTPTPSTSVSGTPAATEGTAGGPVSTTEPWPAPPTGPVTEPWTRPGFDAGRVVSARMEDGHAVVTVDRIQLYSAEQWRARTGESIPWDFTMVNESTRTRQFAVADDAVISVNWQYGETKGSVRLTPQEFVDRTNALLLDKAVTNRKNPGTADETPGVEVFLFHRDGLDGPVAYLEDSGRYRG
jgi:hypothetical protein